MASEFGKTLIEIIEDDPLYEGVWKKGDVVEVWMSHNDYVSQVPPGFRVLAVSLKSRTIAMMGTYNPIHTI